MAALFRPASRGHDAIRAKLVASNLNSDVSLERSGSHRSVADRIETLETGLDIMSRGVVPIQAESILRLARASHFFNEFRQARQLASAADNVDVRSAFADEFLVFCVHAAEYADHLFRVAFLRPVKRPSAE